MNVCEGQWKASFERKRLTVQEKDGTVNREEGLYVLMQLEPWNFLPQQPSAHFRTREGLFLRSTVLSVNSTHKCVHPKV